MPKDYHKGFKLQVYIPEELAERIKQRSQLRETTRTKIVVDALNSYLNTSDSEKSKYYSDKHTI
jgi:hypothetical protein